MMKYIKESHKGKDTIENVVTEIITSFNDNGGEVKVSGGKTNLYPKTDIPLFSIETAYNDLEEERIYESERKENLSGSEFSNTQKKYNGFIKKGL